MKKIISLFVGSLLLTVMTVTGKSPAAECCPMFGVVLGKSMFPRLFVGSFVRLLVCSLIVNLDRVVQSPPDPI